MILRQNFTAIGNIAGIASNIHIKGLTPEDLLVRIVIRGMRYLINVR